MKKMMKACLAIATVAMLAPAASAADTEHSPFGRVRVQFEQGTSKDGDNDAISKMDMAVDARFGHTAKKKGPVWTTEAHAWFDTGHMSDDGKLDDAMDMNIQFSKEDLKILLGRYEATGVWHWAGYADARHANYAIGAQAEDGWGWSERRTGARVSLPKLGLDFDLGINDDGAGTSQTDIQIKYFGWDLAPGFHLAASYHMRSKAIDEAKDASLKGTAADGYAANSMAVSMKYSMDNMNFLFGLDQASKKDGNADDALGIQLINLCFDYGLGGDTNNGVSVTLSQTTKDVSSSVKNTKTQYGVEYAQDVAGTRLWVGYGGDSAVNDSSGAKASTSSGLVARLQFGF